MTGILFALGAAVALGGEIEPLTSGQKTALGWSDTRPLKEKVAHLHQLQREAQALGGEARPVLERLAGFSARYGAGTQSVSAERAAVLTAAHDIRRRALLLDEEYSIMRRAYEFDRGLTLLDGALKTKKDVPQLDLANIAALSRFHDGLRRLLRQIPEALVRDETAFREAQERERLERQTRTLTRAAAAAALAVFLAFPFIRARLTKG